MFHQRLLQMHEHILNDVSDDEFNMAYWWGDSQGCLAGHTVKHFRSVPAGLMPRVAIETNIGQIAGEILGLTHWQAERLFVTEMPRETASGISRAQAARAIENMLNCGCPEWQEVLAA